MYSVFVTSKINIFRISQLELKQQIDSLNEELLKVREALNNHPDLDPYVKKLIACKHKVTVVLNVLQASQVSYSSKLYDGLFHVYIYTLVHYSNTLQSKQVLSRSMYFQDRLNEIRRMVNKEKSVRKVAETPSEPEQSTSSGITAQGGIN